MDHDASFISLLEDHQITADEFFQDTGITQQIRNNLERFVKYCRTHKVFAKRMLTLALNITYAELEDPKLKTSSHAILEVFGNEEPIIAQLFFETEQGEQSDACKQLEGIRSEAERLFNYDDEDEELDERPVELQKYEFAKLSLEILKNPQCNETCLGHLHKIYSFLIRQNPSAVLSYFSQNRQVFDLILQNLKYSSISSLLAQLLTSEDKTKLYTYEGFKKQVIEIIISRVFESIQDEQFFDSAMILVEEIINTTKQSYYEYFEDFKRVSNLLVSRQVMDKFYEVLLQKNEKSFKNTSKFLEYLFSRINTEAQDNNYYHKGEETEPSMNFQIDIFYNNIVKLVELVPQIQPFKSLTKIYYISFLEALFASSKIKQYSFSINQQCIIRIIDCLDHQQKAGIYTSKIYNLVTLLIKNATREEINLFLEGHPQLFANFFSSIRNANYSNTKIYNKNQSSGFDVSIINQLSKKNEGVISTASKDIGKDFLKICKKYDIKIASFQDNNSNSPEQQSTYCQENGIKVNEQNNTNNFSLNLVGKNNISIPILHLPDRNNNKNDNERHERTAHHSHQMEQIRINGVQQIYQVQDVMILTEKFQMFSFKDKCHIERPPELSRNQRYSDDEKIGIVKQQTLQAAAVAKSEQIVKIHKMPEEHERSRFFTRHLTIFP